MVSEWIVKGKTTPCAESKEEGLEKTESKKQLWLEFQQWYRPCLSLTHEPYSHFHRPNACHPFHIRIYHRNHIHGKQTRMSHRHRTERHWCLEKRTTLLMCLFFSYQLQISNLSARNEPRQELFLYSQCWMDYYYYYFCCYYFRIGESIWISAHACMINWHSVNNEHDKIEDHSHRVRAHFFSLKTINYCVEKRRFFLILFAWEKIQWTSNAMRYQHTSHMFVVRNIWLQISHFSPSLCWECL